MLPALPSRGTMQVYGRGRRIMQKDKTVRGILLAAMLLLAMPCLAQQTAPFSKRHDRDKGGLVAANEPRAFRQAPAKREQQNRPEPAPAYR